MKSALAFCLALALAAAPAWAAKKGSKSAPKKAGYLDWIKLVSVEGGPLSADGREVGEGFYAAVGVKFNLPSDSKVVFTLGKEGAVEFRGPASFAVVGGAQPGFELWRGRILAVLPKPSSRFHIHAQGMVAVIRGSTLYMDLPGRHDLYLCVCEGTVHLTDKLPRGYRKTITAGQHKGVGLRRSAGTTIESDHEMEGHTDEEIEALRAFVP